MTAIAPIEGLPPLYQLVSQLNACRMHLSFAKQSLDRAQARFDQQHEHLIGEVHDYQMTQAKLEEELRRVALVVYEKSGKVSDRKSVV